MVPTLGDLMQYLKFLTVTVSVIATLFYGANSQAAEVQKIVLLSDAEVYNSSDRLEVQIHSDGNVDVSWCNDANPCQKVKTMAKADFANSIKSVINEFRSPDFAGLNKDGLAQGASIAAFLGILGDFPFYIASQGTQHNLTGLAAGGAFVTGMVCFEYFVEGPRCAKSLEEIQRSMAEDTNKETKIRLPNRAFVKLEQYIGS